LPFFLQPILATADETRSPFRNLACRLSVAQLHCCPSDPGDQLSIDRSSLVGWVEPLRNPSQRGTLDHQSFKAMGFMPASTNQTAVRQRADAGPRRSESAAIVVRVSAHQWRHGGIRRAGPSGDYRRHCSEQVRDSTNRHQSTIKSWLAVLDKTAELKPGLILPDHSPPGDASMIPEQRAFMFDLLDRARVIKGDGKSVEEATRQIATEFAAKYPGWLRPGQHDAGGGAGLQGGAMSNVWRRLPRIRAQFCVLPRPGHRMES
jgi:hypothetical protein